MNRRGNVPMIILFLVALCLVLTALFAFISSSGQKDRVSKNINLLLENSSDSLNIIKFESILIAQDSITCKDCASTDLKNTLMEVAGKREEFLRVNGETLSTNLFYKIRSGEFSFERVGQEYQLNFENVFIDATQGENKIRKNFGFSVEFDVSGEFKRFINKIYVIIV